MKYKILLTGRNKTVIDDFFSHLDEDIEPLTTSIRWDDIIGHIRYFRPDAFCYCVASEVKEHIMQMVSLKAQLEKENIPFIVIGSEEECNRFEREAIKVADLVLRKPLKVSSLEEQLISFIDGRREEEQKRLEKQRKLEEKKRQEEQSRREEQKRLEEARIAKEEHTRRRHILIVDDDSTMLRTIKEQLHEQYEVATAISGRIALKFLERKSTDLILLDYDMPVENGPMVLEELRRNPATKDIPVLFLTGVTERDKIHQALALKPQGYLLKPIEHGELLAAIEAALTGD